MGYTTGGPRGVGVITSPFTPKADMSEILAVVADRGGYLGGKTTAERDAISGASLFTGLMIFNTTTGGLESYSGTGWGPVPVAPRLKHAEYLFTRAAIGDGTTSLFNTTADGAATNDNTFTTISGATGNTVTLVEAGIYNIDFYAQVAAASTGRFAVLILVTGGSPSATQAINAAPSGENTMSTSLSNFRCAANTVLRFEVHKTTGGNADISSRIRITRFGSY